MKYGYARVSTAQQKKGWKQPGGPPPDGADSIGAFYPVNRKGYRDKSLHRPEMGAYAIQPIIK